MNCKPGDLAFVIASTIPQNIGRIVEVIAWSGEMQMWECRSRDPMLLKSGEFLTEHFCEDSRLRPISGVPINDDVTDEVRA
ncbi:hypothetical protein ABXK61_16150 [Burkholderia sola]|uniref:hypothetical protein n=1 Tax=Burkholderia TaxID=32008 RepID=UPI001AE6484B|nr:hypothetical protein [Burkholderia sp. AcTa6-5]MBP0714838.1 hypothetical protein [Burkholderia sp. AcTa6-5]